MTSDETNTTAANFIAPDQDVTATLEAATEAAKSMPASNTEAMDKAAQASKDQKQKLEEVAIYGFTQGYPEFVKKLEQISSRSLRRAWAAAVAGPLMEKEPHFSYPEEKEAYAMAVKLDEYKFSMILLGIDRYMLHGKEKPGATVPSSSTVDGPSAAGQPSEESTPKEETSLSSNDGSGTSSENTATV